MFEQNYSDWTHMNGEATPPVERPALAILRVSRAVADKLGAATAEFGLTTDQWLILELLVDRKHTGLSMTELREMTGLTGATLTRNVDRLIADVLAHREVDATDRRRVLVHASNAGAALHRRSVQAINQAESTLERAKFETTSSKL